MQHYQNILFATDLNTDTVIAARRAVELAHLFHAKLSLAHVVVGLDIGADVNLAPQILTEADLLCVQDAHKRLEMLAQQLDMSVIIEKWLLNSGHVALQIHRLAVEQQIDLIIVASHGKHGFFKLVGSDTTDILEEANCDVLVVRI
ncbi:universal stress protein [Beggiatoa leptomitoformis]|nr:universal stress protein [Beggiatoa leptomitoformis]